jgi:hypothetical protein
MLRIFGAAMMAALLVVTVRAEEKPPVPPEFVPFMVDKANFDAARKYLEGLKYSEAAPLVSWLDSLEAKAKSDWLAANAPKEAPK